MLLLNKGNAYPTISDHTYSHYRLMLFDLSVGGHHPGYIQHLVEYWCNLDISGNLDIIVAPKFVEQHADVLDAVPPTHVDRVCFSTITPEEDANLNTGPSAIDKALRAFQEWGLLRKYAKCLNATHVLLMYFDTAQVPFIFGKQPPCPVSGIYFRPTFHYCTFENHRPSLKDHLQVWRERFNLFWLSRNQKLGTLFCLDPFALEVLHQSRKEFNVTYLADPVKTYTQSEIQSIELKGIPEVDADKKIMLFFGALTKRKGIDQVIDAISLLPSKLCQKICLLLVGPLGSDTEDKQRLHTRLARLSESLAVQVIVRDCFISDHEIQPYFQAADVILAPYQRHVGMSAILVRAAVSQKPVLSSDYGLMGEITRRYGLGITVDSCKSRAIALGLMKCLTTPTEQLGDRQKMQLFAEQNSVERFAETIFQGIVPGLPGS